MDAVINVLQQDFCCYGILKATSSLVRTNHWSSPRPEGDSSLQSDPTENFKIILGLCLHSFTINHDYDIPIVICLEVRLIIQLQNSYSFTRLLLS
jgi:hypothetical protein